LADRENPLRLSNIPSGPWRKIGGDTRRGAGEGADETVSAVVEVREPGYVPNAARRRSAISATLFTAEVERRRLPDLERDPLVVSVELGRPLHRSE
jgi:hypothetical protein